MPIDDAPSGIQVAWPSVARLLTEDTIGQVFLVVRPNGAPRWSLADDPDTMDAVVSASEQVNEAFDEEGAQARNVWPSPYGPVVEVENPDHDETRAWITAFTDQLAGSGLQAVLEPAAHLWMPGWLQRDIRRPKITALHAYTLDGPSAPPGTSPPRKVDPNVTAGICHRAVQWCSAVQDAHVYVSQGGSRVELDDPATPRELAATWLRDIDTGVMHARRQPMTVRCAHFSSGGEAGYQVDAPGLPWQERVDAVSQTLRQQPEHLDLAIVLPMRAWVFSWFDLGHGGSSLPSISEGEWRSHRSLWAQFTPDAYGIQVLTKAHLARTNDLTDWRIEQIAPERYLIQAKDLEPWYAGDQPDPDVLTAARHDFGNMILTREAIREHLPR